MLTEIWKRWPKKWRGCEDLIMFALKIPLESSQGDRTSNTSELMKKMIADRELFDK